MVSTRYGKIPDSELILPKLPNKPRIKIGNYLKDVCNKKIDDKTTYIQIGKCGNFRNILEKFKISNRNRQFISLQKLVNLDTSYLKEIFEKADFLKTKYSDNWIKYPKHLTPKLSYFIGFFCGDGGLKNICKSFRKRGVFEYKIKIGDEFYIQTKLLKDIFNSIFSTDYPIRDERIEKGENYYYLEPTSKVIYRFLVGVFDFPCGSKTTTVRTPIIILNSNKRMRKWFMRGLMDADGGTNVMESYTEVPKHKTIRLNSRSHKIVLESKEMFENDWNIEFNGPYFDKRYKSWRIEITKRDDIIKLYNQKLFIHPIKRWRLRKLRWILN